MGLRYCFFNDGRSVGTDDTSCANTEFSGSEVAFQFIDRFTIKVLSLNVEGINDGGNCILHSFASLILPSLQQTSCQWLLLSFLVHFGLLRQLRFPKTYTFPL